MLTGGHEPLLMKEKILSQVQVAVLQRIHAVKFHDEVCSCEIHKAVNIKLLHL